MRRKLAVLLAASAVCTSVPVFGAEAPADLSDEQIVNLVMGADPEDWDPCNRINTTTSQQMTMAYEGLYRETDNGNEPALAESYEANEDGTVYTFTIRQGAAFADGTPITAHDFEYTWKRAMDPTLANEYAWFMEPILGASDYMYCDPSELSEEEVQALKDAVGVKALDDYTLEVTLASSCPYFISMIVQPPFAVLSQSFIESNGLYETYGDEFESILCSGPFVLTQWDNDVSMKFEKNDNYWDKDHVYLDEINIQIITESSTELLMYDSGQIDMTYNTLNTADSTYYADALPDEYYSPLVIATGWAGWNCDPEINEKNGWPFADANVRKALAAAIDQEVIAQTIIGGGVTAATGFVPTSLTNPADPTEQWNNGEAYLKTTADPEAAAEYLRAAGWEWEGDDPEDLSTGTWYKDGEAFPVIEVNMGSNDEPGRNIATAWIGYWNKIGIQGALDPEETAQRRETRNNGEFMLTFMGWGGDYADASTFLECMESDHFYNYGHWANEEYDALMEDSKATIDQQKRYEDMLAAEQLIFDDMPVLMFQFSTICYLQKPYLKGVHISPVQTRDFKSAYIEGK